MTFVICLFIFLMQFFWRYMEEMIGKGLDNGVLVELFVYAAIGLVPQSLPIAVLLASLITFGNLGESFELISMKASGISLLQIMKPLIIFMLFICVGVFLFQDYVIPEAQKRMYALLISVKRKAPELDIPEGAFYSQIEGFNLYVKNKDPKTRLLKDVMIYDFSGGFENASIIVADSGYLKMAADKQHLMLDLYSGELFENLKKQRSVKENVPYRREAFETKEILISFDASFNRMADSTLQDQYVSKNRKQLRATADSLEIIVDSLKRLEGKRLAGNTYLYVPGNKAVNHQNKAVRQEIRPISFDSVFRSISNKEKINVLSSAVSRSEMVKQDLMSRNFSIMDDDQIMRRHEIEWHRKFTLSVACLIFFFIGAPLGAIIRKGGLGMPVVVSVLLFLFYHIIDNTNYKMARDGMIPVWQGIWMSSLVLTLLGAFFTYKAINDSTLLNADTYVNFFKQLFGKRPTRDFERKEIVIFETDYFNVLKQSEVLTDLSRKYLNLKKLPDYFRFWKDRSRGEQLQEIIDMEERIVGELVNSRNAMIVSKMNQYPIIPSYRNCAPFKNEYLNLLLGILFPAGLLWYIQAFYYEKRTGKDLTGIIRLNSEISRLINDKEQIKIDN
ncbi:MAG: LptF/LptG family permease [Candidatus Azobacteroides sp.]|nr:LptF/LptG family permease [Candidatus Azobacteroides sp.]